MRLPAAAAFASLSSLPPPPPSATAPVSNKAQLPTAVPAFRQAAPMRQLSHCVEGSSGRAMATMTTRLLQQLATSATHKMWLVSVALVLLLQHCLPGAEAGSCREAQLCCNGRDSSCVVQKAPINAILEDLNDKPCYCDHACLKLGDCCSDFKEHCGVLDCQVSDWGQWSDCNVSCGAGITTRSRKIIQAAQNGGKHCPTLVQKRACQGFRCHGHRHDKRILRETALLLPSAITHHRHGQRNQNGSSAAMERPGGPSMHGHQQQGQSQGNKHTHQREEEYCVEFEVLRSSKACHKLPPYNLLIEGDRIVVRCDLEAFVPDFLASVENNTLPPAANGKHHNAPAAMKAKYQMPYTSAMMDEEEPEDSDENMIDNSESSSSASEEHDDYDTASLTMKLAAGASDSPAFYSSSSTTKTTTTTSSTTTTTTPYPPPIFRQFHCRGEGLPGRTTRWAALAAPSCRGKWLRLTLDVPKKCSHPQFAFV